MLLLASDLSAMDRGELVEAGLLMKGLLFCLLLHRNLYSENALAHKLKFSQ